MALSYWQSRMKPFAHSTTKEKAVELLRWCCVLPAAKLGDMVGSFLGGTLGLVAQRMGIVNPHTDDSASNRLLRYLVYFFPVGMTAVIAAAEIAPRWRVAVAIAVAGIWILAETWIHGFQPPILVAAPVSAVSGVLLIACLELRNRRRGLRRPDR